MKNIQSYRWAKLKPNKKNEPKHTHTLTHSHRHRHIKIRPKQGKSNPTSEKKKRVKRMATNMETIPKWCRALSTFVAGFLSTPIHTHRFENSTTFVQLLLARCRNKKKIYNDFKHIIKNLNKLCIRPKMSGKSVNVNWTSVVGVRAPLPFLMA